MPDLSFRPATHWPAAEPSVSGAPSAAQRAEALEPGKQHPAFLGGAYLPEGEPGEVEIARIESRSTTADVVSIRAHREGGRIGYRVVDEYEMEWVVPTPAPDEPLTLGELLELVDGAHPAGEPEWRGLTNPWCERNLIEPSDVRELVDFLRVTSRFYPELEAVDRERAEAWALRILGGP